MRWGACHFLSWKASFNQSGWRMFPPASSLGPRTYSTAPEVLSSGTELLLPWMVTHLRTLPVDVLSFLALLYHLIISTPGLDFQLNYLPSSVYWWMALLGKSKLRKCSERSPLKCHCLRLPRLLGFRNRWNFLTERFRNEVRELCSIILWAGIEGSTLGKSGNGTAQPTGGPKEKFQLICYCGSVGTVS